MTILCEHDPAAAEELAAPLAAENTVQTVRDVAAAALAVDADPDVGVVVIGQSARIDEVFQFAKHVHVQRPGVAVLLVRRGTEPNIVEAAIAAGVTEVIPSGNPAALVDAHRRAWAKRPAPATPSDPPDTRSSLPLAEDLPRVAEPDVTPVDLIQPISAADDAAPRPAGKVVTVFSPKGGSGKTTIATNLAVALSQHGYRVCLIDLDLEFGDVAISLRLTPHRTLADAASEMRHGEDEIEQLLTPYQQGMDCVLAPIEPGESERIPVSVVPWLLERLPSRYEYVLIDTPSQFSEHVLAALDASDVHVLLTNPELPALKNLRLTLDMFDLLGYDRGRRYIVFNRDDAAVGLTAADVEHALKSPISVHVPASRDVPASINRGVPIVAAKPDHPVSVAVRRFAAERLTDEVSRHDRRSGRLTRLLRRR